MEREELLDDEGVLVGGAFGIRRDAPVVEQLRTGHSVIVGRVQADHGLGVADIDREQHAPLTLSPSGVAWDGGRLDGSDAVRTPLVTGEEVLLAGHRDIGAEDVSEELELGAAQPRARGGRFADRTVVLDEHDIASVDANFGHVPLVSATRGERFRAPSYGRTPARHRGGVGVALLGGTRLDHLLEAALSDGSADRADELDREVGVAIGKELGRKRRERPQRRGSSPALWRSGAALDELRLFEPGEVLSHRGLGEAEVVGESRRGGRSRALEAIHESAACDRHRGL